MPSSLDPVVSAALQSIVNIYRQSNAFYQSMEYALRELSFKGMSCWAHEMGHGARHKARNLARYMTDRDSAPSVVALSAEPLPSGDPASIFQVSSGIEDKEGAVLLAAYKTTEAFGNDIASCEYIESLIEKQSKEDADLEEIMSWFETAGSEGSALFILDKKIKKLAKKYS